MQRAGGISIWGASRRCIGGCIHLRWRWMHPPTGSMHQTTDGQQAGSTHPTGMHSFSWPFIIAVSAGGCEGGGDWNFDSPGSPNVWKLPKINVCSSLEAILWKRTVDVNINLFCCRWPWIRCYHRSTRCLISKSGWWRLRFRWRVCRIWVDNVVCALFLPAQLWLIDCPWESKEYRHN